MCMVLKQQRGPYTDIACSSLVPGCLKVEQLEEYTTSCGTTTALQKQIGCFNYRVVTLVADKQKKHW